MTPETYVENAIRTEPTDYKPALARIGSGLDHGGPYEMRSSAISVIRLLHGSMGLVTEAGELQDALKKFIFYGKPLDRVNLQEEIGDAFWYLAVLAHVLGLSFGGIFETNINKLRARFPEKFAEFAALARDLKGERAVLEAGSMPEAVLGVPMVLEDDGGGCQRIGEGGDCPHYIGLPGKSIPGQHDGDDDTMDAYGKPNGWCWSCWKSRQIGDLQALVAQAGIQ